jgi:tryptophan-rich sensory protein
MATRSGIKPYGARDFAGLAGFLLLNLIVSAIGGWVTATSVDSWYQSLEKPPLNPPDWIFAPVWMTLYILIAVAGWRVWRKAGIAGAPRAFSRYFLQLVLNLAWSFLFFGAHRQDRGSAVRPLYRLGVVRDLSERHDLDAELTGATRFALLAPIRHLLG